MQEIIDHRNTYTLSEFIQTGISYILTKLFWPKAKLIRYPIYIRGKRNFKYGKGLGIGFYCRIDATVKGKTTLVVGENFDLGDMCHISALNNVRIGDNFLCGQFVYIGDISHGLYTEVEPFTETDPNSIPKDRPVYADSVYIGNNVWVGDHCAILPGAEIGNGCIIGANSVVNSKIPDDSIAVGCPAKVIKMYNRDIRKWERVSRGEK